MNGKRILVIDDEDDIREVAQLSLEMVGGWQVLTASSGPEGIEVASEQKPDAILLDVMMPELDGPSTFKKLQDNPETAKIPVILLTAKVLSADRQRFAELGVTAIVAKPFDPMNLATQVAELLGWNF
ncbi:response regulator [Oxynema aestuarii]|uniref:Response regulator n=1 Tax=Oxynema aestuarii AP17 TaxID=2064643 RepID=A0A6H1TXR3_9CYAN|nr:response regulator [Oxynema aestuarii]QIZ71392.1 response regulator [Oxynema aestuarii AP17]RMH77432.1 MAG: response regulator [Cyanobacteria bacterium J007]